MYMYGFSSYYLYKLERQKGRYTDADDAVSLSMVLDIRSGSGLFLI